MVNDEVLCLMDKIEAHLEQLEKASKLQYLSVRNIEKFVRWLFASVGLLLTVVSVLLVHVAGL
jgi:hypothetical protein